MKEKKMVKIISPIVLLLIIISAILVFSRNKKTEITKRVSVKTIEASRTDSFLSTPVSGFAKGESRALVAPVASGRILGIYKKEGDFVQKGEALAVIDANVAQSQSLAANASIEALKKTLSVGEKYYDQLVDQAKGASSDVPSSQGVTEGIQSAKKARDLQMQNIKDQIISAQGAASIAKENVKNYTIIAPFSGQLLAMNAKVGDFANVSVPLFSLATPNSLEIEAYVGATQGKNIFIGQSASLSAENGAPFTGKVIAVSPASDQESFRTLVRIRLENIPETVAIGDFIRGEIFIPAGKKTISVPKSAIVTRAGDAVVFLVDTKSIIKEQPVKTGGTQENTIEIVDGLSEGQKIVSEGQQYLVNGLTVSEYGSK